jgi:ParB-like chromosome segregation protein Spo0J
MSERSDFSIAGAGDVSVDHGDTFPPISSPEEYPVTSVEINRLVFEGSPRLAGEDPDHTRALAEVDAVLPPITVHRPTMRVIDGMHRIRAALLKGERVIRARMVDCDEATAFVLAVKANIAHGLPLSATDRKAAAASIIASHPQWSDRAVAASTGLSDKTVSAIRTSSTAELPQSDTRLGKDGRVRPLNSAILRRRAAAMLIEQPRAGVREIARATGLSPATVRDVRTRTDKGEDPVPPKYRTDQSRDLSSAPSSAQRHSAHARQLEMRIDRETLLAKLQNDPSVRFSEGGRHVLRWLHHHTVDSESCQDLGSSVPDHWATLIADLARSCALAWTGLAEQLEQRSPEAGSAG